MKKVVPILTLAGTRPPTVDEWDKYELHHRARLATKPGLTGMWQVSGRSNITDLVAKVIGYEGEIKWDSSKPNGTPRKLLDVSKATNLGWTYKTELEEGIRLSYEDFLNNPMRAER